MKYYKLWVLAFFLKLLGSTWDSSYHFKYFFEEYSLPHIINAAGFVLGLILLYAEFRKPKYLTWQARGIITVGVIIFFAGIPTDFANHESFGLDVTTWSSPHFLYYIGTTLMIWGVWKGYWEYVNETPTWGSLHTIWAAFLLENLLFPNLQQEYGAITAHQWVSHTTVLSKDLLHFVQSSSEPAMSIIYGGVPMWMYPLYSLFVISVLFAIVHKRLGDGKILLFASVIYIVFRYLSKLVFLNIHYPTSYVPFVIIIVIWLWYVLQKHMVLAGFITSIVYFCLMYVISSIWVAPPMHVWYVFIGIVVSWIGSYLVYSGFLTAWKPGLIVLALTIITLAVVMVRHFFENHDWLHYGIPWFFVVVMWFSSYNLILHVVRLRRLKVPTWVFVLCLIISYFSILISGEVEDLLG